jgi:hypothetical protein
VTVTAGNWYDADGISTYNFYFSYDGGDIYIPCEKADDSANTFSTTFQALYKATNTFIKCEAIDNMGFVSSSISTLTVLNDPS